MSTGNGLALRLKLKQLGVQHRVATQGDKLPLSDPTSRDMVLCGFASTNDLDWDRTKMRPYAFGYPLRKSCRAVPLLYKHDPNQVAGTIEDLEYDDVGNLCVWAVVTHDLAKRCGAFSIRAVVNDYEIKDADSPNFYAVIKTAELVEISLTDTPSNPHALVMDRYPVSPAVKVLELLTEKMRCLQQMTIILQKGVHS